MRAAIPVRVLSPGRSLPTAARGALDVRLFACCVNLAGGREATLPDFTVITGASDRELRQQESMRQLKTTLITLTANLIRIVRGAGVPDRILEQVRHFAEAYAAYFDAHGHEAPPGLINELLAFKHPELSQNDNYADVVLTDHAICRSALQVVASSLLQQRPQLDKAWSHLHSTLDLREVRRAQRGKRGRGVTESTPERMREAMKEARLTTRHRELRDIDGIEPKTDPRK
jgi:hypothetical protein